VVRGARLIGTSSPTNHDYLRSLGPKLVAYGNVAASGVLPEFIALTGAPAVTIIELLRHSMTTDAATRSI
jgi:hypothetical protein